MEKWSAKQEIKFASNGKYLRKLDGDLAGRVLHLAMDDGAEYELHFVTGDIVEYRAEDGTMHWEKYGCLKAAEGTWFVASILGGAPVRTCITLLIDEPQSLVTMAISRTGGYPLRPRPALVDFVFGAIRVPNQPLPPDAPAGCATMAAASTVPTAHPPSVCSPSAVTGTTCPVKPTPPRVRS